MTSERVKEKISSLRASVVDLEEPKCEQSVSEISLTNIRRLLYSTNENYKYLLYKLEAVVDKLEGIGPKVSEEESKDCSEGLIKDILSSSYTYSQHNDSLEKLIYRLDQFL